MRSERRDEQEDDEPADFDPADAEDLPDGGFKTSWTGSAKQEPLKDGLVVCPMSDGYWEVHPNGTNSKVVYSLRYDAGGSVPTWLVRNFQKGGIADLVEEMKAVAAKM